MMDERLSYRLWINRSRSCTKPLPFKGKIVLWTASAGFFMATMAVCDLIFLVIPEYLVRGSTPTGIFLIAFIVPNILMAGRMSELTEHLSYVLWRTFFGKNKNREGRI